MVGRSMIRSCVCGHWKIDDETFPDPPEGLIDPCLLCGTSQYAYFVREGFLEPAPLPWTS